MKYQLSTLARTGAGFVDFSPYVASIGDNGVVAFQAERQDSVTGVYTSDGSRVVTRVDTTESPLAAIESHPAVGAEGEISFYARDRQGRSGLYLASDGNCRCVAQSGSILGSIGPLGPTMTKEGIAFRANDAAGVAGIYSWRAGAIQKIAEAQDRFVGFEGLPVLDDQGAVVFHARAPGGVAGIYIAEAGHVRRLVDTGDDFHSLGRFPDAAGQGEVAFVGEEQKGKGAAFLERRGKRVRVADTHDGFESFRGVLASAAGCVFYATPTGGTLGIYCGGDPAGDRILGIGDSFEGSQILAFAVNPVSMNACGQLAIRLELSGALQVILRADPLP